MDPDFSLSANSILHTAVDPSAGICIALTCEIGPMLIAGMGEPSERSLQCVQHFLDMVLRILLS